MNRFHYAFKVKDIASTRKFYIDLLGCAEGRSTERWIDFDFWGHQLSAHVSKYIEPLDFCGLVDGTSVPIPHFGCIINKSAFKKIQERLELHPIEFMIKPKVRFEGQPGEQLTMFFCDFSGNPIELKSYLHPDQVFGK